MSVLRLLVTGIPFTEEPVVDLSALVNLPANQQSAAIAAAVTVNADDPQSVIDAVANFQNWFSAALPESLTRNGAEEVSDWTNILGVDNASSVGGVVTDPTYVPSATGSPAYISFDGISNGLEINSLLGMGGQSARTVFLAMRVNDATTQIGFSLNSRLKPSTASRFHLYGITPEIGVRVFGGNKLFSGILSSDLSFLLIQNPANATVQNISAFLNGEELIESSAVGASIINILGDTTGIGFRAASFGGPDFLFGQLEITEILTSNTMIDYSILNVVSRFLNELGSYAITFQDMV